MSFTETQYLVQATASVWIFENNITISHAVLRTDKIELIRSEANNEMLIRKSPTTSIAVLASYGILF